MTLHEKIEWLRRWAPTQPDIRLCSRVLDICDAATGRTVSIKDAVKAIKDHPLRAGGIIDLDEAAQCCAVAWGLKHVD